MAVVAGIFALVVLVFVGAGVLQGGWELAKIVRASVAPGKQRPIVVIGTPAIAAAMWVIARQRGPVGWGVGVICLLVGWGASLAIAALSARSSGHER